MKLVLAIVNKEDCDSVIAALSENGYSVTKLASTGGFLRAGNSTVLVGTEDGNVEHVCGIIKAKSHARTQMHAPSPFYSDLSVTQPVEITVGGATIFVLDVDRWEKV